MAETHPALSMDPEFRCDHNRSEKVKFQVPLALKWIFKSFLLTEPIKKEVQTGWHKIAKKHFLRQPVCVFRIHLVWAPNKSENKLSRQMTKFISTLPKCVRKCHCAQMPLCATATKPFSTPRLDQGGPSPSQPLGSVNKKSPVYQYHQSFFRTS